MTHRTTRSFAGLTQKQIDAARLKMLDELGSILARNMALSGPGFITDTKQFVVDIYPIWENNGTRGGWIVNTIDEPIQD